MALIPTAAYALLSLNDAPWRWIVSSWPWSDGWLFATLTTVVHEGLYFGVNGILLLCQRLDLGRQWRIPRTAQQEVTPELFAATIRGALIGGLLLQLPAVYLLYLAMVPHGTDVRAPLPPVHVVYLQLLVCLAFLECTFYWTHRWLHHPALYTKFHKKHV